MQFTDEQAKFATSSFEEMGKLMGSAKGHAKSAKRAKTASDRDTIRAHALNIACINVLGLVDEFYGVEGHRNNDSGPEYRGFLTAAGFSEAKAKLFWEYGQLSLKEPVMEAGDFTGLKDAAKDGMAVLKFLAKQGVEKEADLKKVVQPVKAKTFEEKVLELVEKEGLDLAAAAEKLQTVLDTLEEKATQPVVETTDAGSSIMAALAKAA